MCWDVNWDWADAATIENHNEDSIYNHIKYIYKLLGLPEYCLVTKFFIVSNVLSDDLPSTIIS